MEIKRIVTKNKQIVYVAGDNEFSAVINSENALIIGYPGKVITRSHQRVIDKLIAKAKARDGVGSVQIHTGLTLAL
ncbi:hypothetical protein NR609_004203 [Salmonella enterica]|nr:hypothetical protein [Salmonella enterica]